MKTAMPRAMTPIARELLLVGGGHAHVAVLRHFGRAPVPGVRVTLLSRDTHTPYSGMLPGLVAGHYSHEDCHIDLRRLCEATGARLIRGTLNSIDTVSRTAEVAERSSLAWDMLSINTGSAPALDSIAGARDHGIALKPIDRFISAWETFERSLTLARSPPRVMVVGGGAAAVEMALALSWRLEQSRRACRITLLAAGEQLLETHNPQVRRLLNGKLAAAGIDVRLGVRVTAVTATQLELADGTQLGCDLAVWAIHAGAPSWTRTTGLACDAAGFLAVDDTLRSVSNDGVFAAGDIAALPVAVAKSGVYAVREGQVLAHNLSQSLRGAPLRAYRPQRRFLSLLATGPRHAVASRGPLYASGDWVWRWKDRIDRRFMAMYALPPLPPAAPGTEPAMRCGGCAAKVGSEMLSGMLDRLAAAPRADIPHGIASGEDAAVIQPPAGQLLVQSVDYFRSFTDDPWLLGRIGAVHCLGDLHAMGAQPHSALAIATIPHGAPGIVRETLDQLMLGARSTLMAESVTLAGGHSGEGAELGFGLSVNGFVAPSALLLKSALQPGQALILTKAVGSGVLLAANMAGAARGDWIDAALTAMQQGHAAAMKILREHGISACTDVTGFGLLGHLGEMLRASGIGARLDLLAIPSLRGARECLSMGYRSSLHGANAAALAALEGFDPVDDATLALLVDPQTAGGLLAAVPEQLAPACVSALHAAGYAAATVFGCTDANLRPGRIGPR